MPVDTQAFTGVGSGVRCDRCGQELRIGDWPFCPHPRALREPSSDPSSGMGTLGEFHPYYDEHVCPEGAWVTSIGQRKALMRANNMDHRGRKVGKPGCEI